jgi:hypothetical protein
MHLAKQFTFSTRRCRGLAVMQAAVGVQQVDGNRWVAAAGTAVQITALPAAATQRQTRL